MERHLTPHYALLRQKADEAYADLQRCIESHSGLGLTRHDITDDIILKRELVVEAQRNLDTYLRGNYTIGEETYRTSNSGMIVNVTMLTGSPASLKRPRG